MFIRKWLKTRKDRAERRRLREACTREVAENLENYYVMFQLRKFRFFSTEKAALALLKPDYAACPEVVLYFQRLDAYNKVLGEYKDFEQWFAADINHKTKDNGLILHTRQERVKEQFEGLEPVILAARDRITGLTL